MVSRTKCSPGGNMIALGFLFLFPAAAIIGFDGQEILRKPTHSHHHYHASSQHDDHMLNRGQHAGRKLKVRPAWDIEQGLIHYGRRSARSITLDFGMKPELMGAIQMMRAEVCASMKQEHDKDFGSYDSCVKFMKKACSPGGDKVMDGGKGEKTSGRGYCDLFFPAALKDNAVEKEKEAAAKKKKVEAAAAAKAAAEAEAAAAEKAEAAAKKKAEEEEAAEAAAKQKAQEEAAAAAAAKAKVAEEQKKEDAANKAAAEATDAASKKKAEDEAAAASAAKNKAQGEATSADAAQRQAEEDGASAGARKNAERAKEKASGEKKNSEKEKAKQKGVELEGDELAEALAIKVAAEAMAEAAIAEAIEKYKASVAAAPGPAPAPPVNPKAGGQHMDLEWARRMDQDAPMPEQGFMGALVNHEDGDTMTDDWMKERTPASHLCAICAKSPDNPWCRGKCRKKRRHPTTETRSIIDVVREAVGGAAPRVEPTPSDQATPDSPELGVPSAGTASPSAGNGDNPQDVADGHQHQARPPPRFPDDAFQSSTRRATSFCAGLIGVLALLK